MTEIRSSRRTFRFVSGLPSNAREKEHNRSVIRTHAANSTRWRISSQNVSETSQTEKEVAGLNATHQVTNVDENQHAAFLAACHKGLHTIAILPTDGISVLPQAETMSLLSSIHKLFKYDFVLSWGNPEADALNLMQFIVSDNGLLHSFLFSQQTRNQALAYGSSSLEKRQAFACYAQAVQQTNLRLTNPGEAYNDANILSVLMLAYHGPVRGRRNDICAPQQGPLSSLQNLHLYGGSIGQVALHQEALHRMVNFRGGLGALTPCIAQMITVADIISSSQSLTCPKEPYLLRPNDVSVPLRRQVDHSVGGLGRGFSALWDVAMPSNGELCRNILTRLCHYTIDMDDYLAARLSALPLEWLAERRNHIQHSLLSLSSALNKDGESLLWLCMQATIIYSFLCTFPLQNAPLHELARSVKVCLTNHHLREEWLHAPRLMTWMIVMSAIAAMGSPDRLWYLAVLERCVHRQSLSTWGDLRKLLTEFLWYPNTNDIDGEKLWTAIQESVPFHLDSAIAHESSTT